MPSTSNVTFKQNIISIAAPGATTDWGLHTGSITADINRLRPGIPIQRIELSPGASRDRVVIKNGSASGVEMCRLECGSSYDQKVEYFYGGRHRPYIDTSLCAHGKTTGSVLKIVME